MRRQVLVSGLYAVPSLSSSWPVLPPHTIHSEPVHTDADCSRRFSGGSGNVRQLSLVGLYARGVITLDESPPSDGHTNNSVPVHAAGERSLMNPEGGVRKVLHESVAGSYAKPDDSGAKLTRVWPPMRSISVPVHSTSALVRSQLTGGSARVRQLFLAGSYADAPARNWFLSSRPPTLIASRPVHTTYGANATPRGSGAIGAQALAHEIAGVAVVVVTTVSIVGAAATAVEPSPETINLADRSGVDQTAIAPTATRPAEAMATPARRLRRNRRPTRAAADAIMSAPITGARSTDDRCSRNNDSIRSFIPVPESRSRFEVARVPATAAISPCPR